VSAPDDSTSAPRGPRHVAIIMDGNGRWARSRGLPRIAGHRAGTENIRQILEAAVEFGIKVLTIYAFSTENWERPLDEVRGLLRIMGEVIQRETPNLHKNGVKVRHIGRETGLPRNLVNSIRRATALTANNDRIILNVAFNYGGRAEIVDAVKQLIAEAGQRAPEALSLDWLAEQISEDAISHSLYTAGQPDPDLIIRTGGDLRISNFLIWQAAYAEYYSTPVYWPDFDGEELRKAMQTYGARERRFGRVSG
jgi:undecaprenyl diphosphate synthase